MKLAFIALDRLSVSKANMRHGKAPPEMSDILPFSSAPNSSSTVSRLIDFP